jgi:cobalt-precorrin-5B (C1)-methyltransferase
MENGYERILTVMTEGCEERIRTYVKNSDLKIRVIMYSMDYGILGGIYD